MALYATFAEAGDGQVTNSGIVSRTFRVDSGEGYYEVWFEETYSETTKWVGLTEDAAQEPIDANGQPEDPEATYSYAKSLDNQIICSYSLERVYTRIRKTLVENGDLDAPTFDPEGEAVDGRQDMHTAALDVDISSLADTKIWYRVDQWTGWASPNGYYVLGDWVEGTDNSETVSLSPTNTNGDAYYRLVRLSAYCTKVVGEETIISGTTVQEYRDDLVVDVEFDPASNTTQETDFNTTITATPATGEIAADLYYYQGGAWTYIVHIQRTASPFVFGLGGPIQMQFRNVSTRYYVGTTPYYSEAKTSPVYTSTA